MSKKNHPNFDMLKSFLDFLRDEEFTLLGNSTFKEKSEWGNTPPRKGDKVAINIYYKATVPSESKEKILINSFLDDYTDYTD